VTNIDNFAFSDCTGLTSVTIEDGVTSIGREAFYGCDSLTSIVVPKSVTTIGMDAFSQCKALDEITILNPECTINAPKGIWGSDDLTIYGYAGSSAQELAETYGHTFVALGNIDGDEVIDLKDANLLFELVNGQTVSTVAAAAADVTGDGAVDLKDVTHLYQYISGQIDTL
jgi:hypothetical protein